MCEFFPVAAPVDAFKVQFAPQVKQLGDGTLSFTNFVLLLHVFGIYVTQVGSENGYLKLAIGWDDGMKFGDWVFDNYLV